MSFAGFRSLKANFTPTPNQYFDKVVGHYHPCVERVVALLIRSTLGWEDPDTGERRLEAELALKDFICPEMSESSARKGIAGAIEAGFIVQTLAATNKQAACYALRWENLDAQKAAIGRQRKAHGSSKRRGVPVDDPAWKKRTAEGRGVTATPHRGVTVRPLAVTGVTVTPPNKNDSEKKSSSEKKLKNSERKASGKVFLPAASSEGNALLGLLPQDEYAALEKQARELVIAENGPPVSDLARQGKAHLVVKRRMRELLAAQENTTRPEAAPREVPEEMDQREAGQKETGQIAMKEQETQ